MSTPSSRAAVPGPTLVLTLAGMLCLWLLIASGAEAIPINVTLRVDPNVLSGADPQGRLLLYTPNPLEPGSSISHWDTSATPNLLMEPNINADLGDDLDLTPRQMQDIGWSTGGSATIQLHFNDPANQGFNLPNLGPLRQAAAQRAADIWASTLDSSITIHIDVSFDDLPCSTTDGAVLAQAGATFLFQDDSFPFADTWYHGALAEALAAENLSLQDIPDPEAGDIQATFNSDIDNACLGAGSGFDYSLSGVPAPGKISFLGVAMHEFGHGLGFGNFLNEATGEFFMGSPDIYTQFIRDNSKRKIWARMSPPEIQDSSINTGNIVWTGANTKQGAKSFLNASPAVTVNMPNDLGSFTATVAQFGPSVEQVQPTGDLVLYDDGSASPTLACGPSTTSLVGKVALIDRGTCNFDDKVKNAENAGAVGVIVANNVPGLINMGGDDFSITIPSLMITQDDGQTLKDTLAATEPPDNPPDDPPEDPVDPPEDPVLSEDLPDEPPSVCVTSGTSLCLNSSRYRVEIDWQDSQGNSGQGMAFPLTDDTGYFTFFAVENVEVVLKVLDACPFANAFWVFAGGLTNVETEIRVVDTSTGKGKLYRNPLDTPFQPIQDTAAFATCP